MYNKQWNLRSSKLQRNYSTRELDGKQTGHREESFLFATDTLGRRNQRKIVDKRDKQNNGRKQRKG